MRSQLRWMAGALLVWASCTGQARAHLVNSGFGPFYDGIAHVFVTPEDLLAIVAISLLAGLEGKACSRFVLFLLPLAWLAGATAGQTAPLTAGMPILSAVLLIALGALVALDRRLPLRLAAGFAVTVGVVHGFFNGAAQAGTNSASIAIVGTVCAHFVVVALLAGQVVSLRKEWARIVVRVAGSWIGAIGLLLLGWAAR
jgi:urease accessory protein